MIDWPFGGANFMDECMKKASDRSRPFRLRPANIKICCYSNIMGSGSILGQVFVVGLIVPKDQRNSWQGCAILDDRKHLKQ